MENKYLTDTYSCSKKIKILNSFINGFILIVLSLLSFFLCGSKIASNTQYGKSYNLSLLKMDSFQHDVGLFMYDDGQKLSSDYVTHFYIYKMVCNTYYYENKDMLIDNEKVELQEKDLLSYKVDNLFKNDFLANYYLIYRETSDIKLNLINPYDGRKNLYEFFYLKILSFDELSEYLNSNVVENTDTYLGNRAILNFDSARKILSYLDNGSKSEEGYIIFEKISSVVNQAYENAIFELSNKSSKYNSIYNELKYFESGYYIAQVLSFSICYLISGLIVFILIPIITNKHQTLGELISRTHVVRIDLEKISYFNCLSRGILSIVTNLYLYGFFVLFYFTYAIRNSGRIFHFTFYLLIIFSILISLISFFSMVINKDNQYLEDKITKTITIENVD